LRPDSPSAARELLASLGAPKRLLRHVELVGEAAERLLVAINDVGAPLNADLVRIGVVLHDAGKILHPEELDQPGAKHEPDGESLLLAHGVTPEVSRICLSHARWETMPVTLEELLVALADKLWKGVRKPMLEERVIDLVAASIGKSQWDIFVDLDTCFEAIAADGADRLERSKL
jgi:hypothetical protein